MTTRRPLVLASGVLREMPAGDALATDTIPAASQPQNLQTGTTYTLVAGDNGLIVDLANAAAITVTLPNSLPAGFNCSLTQSGVGQVTIAAASGTSLRQPDAYTKTRKQWAQIGLYVRSNGSGTAAEWVAGGDMA